MHADDPFQRTLQLFDDGEFALAADLARQFLEDNPDDGRFWQVYGTACWRLKDLAAAQEALEQASIRIPLGPLAQFALAECYITEGHLESAGAIYEHLGVVALNTGLLAAISKRLGELNRFESALQACERIVEIDPSFHQAHFGKAYYLARLGRPPESLIAPLAIAMDLAPHLWTYRMNLAFAWSEMGHIAQAHDLLKPVPLETVRCPCLLRRMRALFERAGDSQRSLLCKVRLSCLLQ